jgi:hypothetical protein
MSQLPDFYGLKEETRLDLLKEKLAESRTLITEGSKTAFIYVVVMGLLLTVVMGSRAVDDPLPDRKVARFISAVGIGISFLQWIICYTMQVIMKVG